MSKGKQKKQSKAEILGDELKMDGIALALENESGEWKARYTKLVPQFLKENYEFTGEDAKIWMLNHGVGEPHTANVWSAMWRSAFIQSGFLVWTGRIKKRSNPQAHSSTVPLWRSLLAIPEGEMISLNSQLIAIAAKVKTHKIDVLTALKETVTLALSQGIDHGT